MARRVVVRLGLFGCQAEGEGSDRSRQLHQPEVDRVRRPCRAREAVRPPSEEEMSNAMTPDQWLADFEAKTAELQRNAAAFRRNLESAGTTMTAEDKSVTVTVAPNGALLDLKIEGNTELAGKILA